MNETMQASLNVEKWTSSGWVSVGVITAPEEYTANFGMNMYSAPFALKNGRETLLTRIINLQDFLPHRTAPV